MLYKADESNVTTVPTRATLSELVGVEEYQSCDFSVGRSTNNQFDHSVMQALGIECSMS